MTQDNGYSGWFRSGTLASSVGSLCLARRRVWLFHLDPCKCKEQPGVGRHSWCDFGHKWKHHLLDHHLSHGSNPSASGPSIELDERWILKLKAIVREIKIPYCRFCHSPTPKVCPDPSLDKIICWVD